jgi:hypothetical protein
MIPQLEGRTDPSLGSCHAHTALHTPGPRRTGQRRGVAGHQGRERERGREDDPLGRRLRGAAADIRGPRPGARVHRVPGGVDRQRLERLQDQGLGREDGCVFADAGGAHGAGAGVGVRPRAGTAGQRRVRSDGEGVGSELGGDGEGVQGGACEPYLRCEVRCEEDREHES